MSRCYLITGSRSEILSFLKWKGKRLTDCDVNSEFSGVVFFPVTKNYWATEVTYLLPKYETITFSEFKKNYKNYKND